MTVLGVKFLSSDYEMMVIDQIFLITVDSIWVVVSSPLTPLKKFTKKRKMQSISFLQVLSNSLRQLFKELSKLYQLWVPVTWPLLVGWYTINPWFSWFWGHISWSFWCFFIKSFLVVRSHQVLVMNVNSLIMSALVPWKRGSKSRFWPFLVDCWHFSSCLFWHKPLA